MPARAGLKCAWHSRVHPLREIHASQVRTEQPPRLPPQLERAVQRLTAESARILHTLRHIDAIDKAGDAAEVLRALWRVKGLLDGAVESARMLWTWQDLFKVCQRVAVVAVAICSTHDY